MKRVVIAVTDPDVIESVLWRMRTPQAPRDHGVSVEGYGVMQGRATVTVTSRRAPALASVIAVYLLLVTMCTAVSYAVAPALVCLVIAGCFWGLLWSFILAVPFADSAS